MYMFFVDTGKVSLGIFCNSSIPRQLLDATEDLGKDPITLKPPGRVNRAVLDRASDMLYTEKEGKVTKTNYFKVQSEFTLKGQRRVGLNGYVFNSSDHLWQADPLYRVTAERSRVFLNSQVLGVLPRKATTWNEAKDICMHMHFVTTRDDGSYECDCAAYWHSVECAHSQAAMHLNGVIDVALELETISHGKRSGRKSNSVPLGYDAHDAPTLVTNRSETQACNYYGTVIARRLNFQKPDRIYIGVVGGTFIVFVLYC